MHSIINDTLLQNILNILKLFPKIFLDLTDFCWEADFVYNRDVGSSFNYKQKTHVSLLKNKLTFVVVSGL
jgi:hypothetical protein